MTARKPGEIEVAVGDLVQQLRVDGDGVAGLGVYALQAKKLAVVLDRAKPDFMATAAVSRELREVVRAMTSPEEKPGGAGDGNPRTTELFARLSAPLGHTSN